MSEALQVVTDEMALRQQVALLEADNARLKEEAIVQLLADAEVGRLMRGRLVVEGSLDEDGQQSWRLGIRDYLDRVIALTPKRQGKPVTTIDQVVSLLQKDGW